MTNEQELEYLATQLHEMFCFKEEETDMLKVIEWKSNDCCWSMEELLPDSFTYPSHRLWLGIATDILEKGGKHKLKYKDFLLDLQSVLKFRAKYGARILKTIVGCIVNVSCDIKGDSQDV